MQIFLQGIATSDGVEARVTSAVAREFEGAPSLKREIIMKKQGRAMARQEKIQLDIIVGNNIRIEREKRRITRDELAEMVGLTTSHLGLIERGERGATPVNLKKLDKIFNTGVDRMFKPASKALVARDSGKNATTPKNALHLKVESYLHHLSEAELEVLAHTIRGIMSMRKYNNGEASNDSASSAIDLN